MGDTKTFETKQVGAQFQLYDTTRGNGIKTYTALNLYFLPGFLVTSRNNNNWTAMQLLWTLMPMLKRFMISTNTTI
ncbi:hypothetical protein [Paenibacillus larvae]|uniref:hypothetical protein n=1 Tax=Paenibacillus larvae TaxID=1464 RepID=UPI00288DE4E8|nr:hypothetical protein [Paenibacillus larvae]MDT2193472.1 hypothetical protein [Paenibacillus larvae]